MTLKKGPILSKKDYDLAIQLGMTSGTISTAPYLKPALGVARRAATSLLRKWIRAGFKRFQTSRPGIGSKITKGPLKLGKTVLVGKAKPGIGRAVVAGAGAAAAGIGVVASHRPTFQKQAQSRPMPARPPAPMQGPKQEEKKCCPAGTKRMVCFKRGRVKKKKKKVRARKARPRRVQKKKRTRKRRKKNAIRR